MSDDRVFGKSQPAWQLARSCQWAWRFLGLLLAGVVASVALSCSNSAQSPKPPDTSRSSPGVLDLTADIEAIEIPQRDPGYLGPLVCAECHHERVTACLNSTHFRACREPVPGEMPAGFAPEAGHYEPPVAGLRFEMTESNGNYWQQTYVTRSGAETQLSSRVDYLYGVGNADSVFLSWEGNLLYELPMVWLYTQNRWAVSHFFPHRGGSFGRELNPRCLECHNTWIEHIPGSLNEYRRENLVLGVTCERCHGPGREHVAFHREHPGLQQGEAIVHPGRLPRERQIEICTQCHSNAIKHLGPAFNYRPGQPLAAAYKSLNTEFPEYDHVANQIQYLRQSKCFQQSESMTCVTCHDPHQKPLPAGVTSSEHSCLSCHQAVDCREQPRLPEEVRSNCVGCHLPPMIKMNVNFQTPDDDYVPPLRRYEHRIAVYPQARDTVLWEWHRQRDDSASRLEASRLAAALVEHHLAESGRLRAAHRYLAAIGACREAVRIEDTPAAREALQEAVAAQAGLDADWNEVLFRIQQNRHAEAIPLLERILKVKPDLARAHFKLGTVLATVGDTTRSRQHLEEAARLDPDDPNAEAMQGWIAYLKNRPQEALGHYERAMEIEPYDADVTYPYALVLSRLGRLDEAAAVLERLLVIDPRHARGARALSEVQREQGEFTAAIATARRAAALTRGEDLDALVNLAECYRRADDAANAERTANLALATAAKMSPEVTATLRRRLEELGIPYSRSKKP